MQKLHYILNCKVILSHAHEKEKNVLQQKKCI